MRLFIGIMTPDPVDDALDDALGATLRGRARDAGLDRWTPREERHLTLRFIGETDGEAAVTRAAARAAASFAAMRMLLGAQAAPLTARVVAVPVAGAEHVAAAVDAALEDEGFAVRDRPFTGHVTVARASHHLRVAAVEQALHHPPLAVPWQAEGIEVIASTSAGPHRYVVRSTHRLLGAAA
ncbi:2'-5' RNA ligase family protein [Demequina gelatinilytica]|uniref:2'-5' RNA ligase family protein n=1 Tax=Demequina gelatinilytica TaxID=1638980 RepID=UPI000783020D|nr:2'-5' RNA ligase family protein [Demequina gelatinilytica]